MRAAAVLSAMLLACGGDEPGQAPPEKPPASAVGCPEDRTCDFDMELGVGLYELEPVAPGDEVVVTLGPQGGFHIWLATRCRGCSDQVLIRYGVRGSADDSWLVGQPLSGIVNLDPAEDDWLQVTGLFGLLPGTPDSIDYVGLSVQLDVTIEDDDRSASRVLPVTVGTVEVWDCPEVDPETCR